ncbi:MAG: hypothetical protein HZA54_13940 [Planctomycetes bacterium]|nr:hypothetical protein [Planctomycetota bacterium]
MFRALLNCPSRWEFVLIAAVLATGASGCSTEALVGGVAGTTVLGARAPTNEIEQIYYLGVLDPQQQLPETIYRVTVHGQASFISGTTFASGWVPAQVIDSLNGRAMIEGEGARVNREPVDLGPGAAGNAETAIAYSGRRLVMFGPEGFREAPTNHRLVIIMGADPSKFFEAIDTALGQVSRVQFESRDAAVSQRMFEALVQLRSERQALDDFQRERAYPVPVPTTPK